MELRFLYDEEQDQLQRAYVSNEDSMFSSGPSLSTATTCKQAVLLLPSLQQALNISNEFVVLFGLFALGILSCIGVCIFKHLRYDNLESIDENS